MQRKLDKRKAYNAGKGKTNEELIHLHMSNHYRRILNAKKAVDNSPPYCYKLRRASTNKPLGTTTKGNPTFENLPLTDRSLSTNSNKESCWGTESFAGNSRYHVHCIPEPPTHEPNLKHNCHNMDLVDRITYDTKNGPAAYCEEAWMEVKGQHSGKRYEAVFEMQQNTNRKKASPRGKRLLSNEAVNESAQKRKFEIQNKTDNPVSAQITLEVPNCKCTKICVCDANDTVLKKISLNPPKEQSLTSSRDSAYNGGVSSLPESRSPTPDQRRKKECCCCCCEKKQRDGKLFEASKPSGSRAASPRPPLPAAAPAPHKHKNQRQESFRKMQEDALYVKFIQDITTEILEKNLYTNKALMKVMRKHVRNNLKKLRKDRMIKEVDNLRIQLGIPEDKTLLEFEGEGEGGDVSRFYPVISDSEFVMPRHGNGGTGLNESCEKMQESASEVLDREDEKIDSGTESDGEVVSVIQVTKSVREKRKEKSVEKGVHRQNSSDDSDRPSDPKKRSVLKNRKLKYVRTYSSSSSESGRSGKFCRSSREATERDAPGPKEAFFGEFSHKSSFLNKKNRSVSFWKNPDLNRVFEVKHKETMSRSKESVLQDGTRDKHKND